MTVTLAMAWLPRGETQRFIRLYPVLTELYRTMVISVPPMVMDEDINRIKHLENVTIVRNDDRSQIRYQALKTAYAVDTDYIQYVDGDRLIRWVETRRDELQQTVQDLQAFDCTVIGRTRMAFDTHPAALRETELIINMIFSDVPGQQLDFGSGSKAFKRDAAAFILDNGRKDSGLGNDTEWPVLCLRGGFTIGDIRVHGLDWETADRNQAAAADQSVQSTLAHSLDSDPKRWQFRVQMAQTIIRAGLDAKNRRLS